MNISKENSDAYFKHLGIFYSAISHLLDVIDHLPCDGMKLAALSEITEDILQVARQKIEEVKA